jgi:hypothetical protein
MSPSKKPYILLDFNLLLWMPDIDLRKYNIEEPKKHTFDRAEEQRAFGELYKMMMSKEIRMGMPNIFPTKLVEKLRQYPELKEKVESFFHKRRLLWEISVMEGSEREKKENIALDILNTKVEQCHDRKHDDPALYILAKFVTPDVTHLATCDIKFINTKAGEYGKALTKDNELNNYIKFLRRNKDLIVDLPSKILEDLRK